MTKQTIVSFLLGLMVALLLIPTVLAKENEEIIEHEWCFRKQFDSQEELAEYRKGDDTFDVTFIKPNGRKVQVYTKCNVTPLPHSYVSPITPL